VIKYLISLILWFPISLLATEANQQTVAELTALLNGINFINANFTQVVTNKSGYLVQEQVGTVQLVKPNLLHWQVLAPDHMLIVTDGNKIWNYDIDLEQVTIKHFSKEINNTKIANLLFGDISKTLSNFEVVALVNKDSDAIQKCNAYTCFELNSNNNSTEEDPFVKAVLGFNKNKKLVMLRFYDQLDQETVFNFYKFRNSVDPKVFKFTLPEDVDVIED